MIVIENYGQRSDGVNLYRSYSSEGYKIERDGELYDEAIDPEGTNRVYTETDQPADLSEPEELTAEEALAIITGGEV